MEIFTLQITREELVKLSNDQDLGKHIRSICNSLKTQRDNFVSKIVVENGIEERKNENDNK